MSSPPVWPWGTPSEWRHRTRYGRAMLLLWLPGLVIAWAVLAVFAAAFLAATIAVWLVGKALVAIYRAWPATYENGGEAA